MITRLQLAVLLAVALIAFAGSLALAGEPPTMQWIFSFGATVGVTMACLTAFEKWVWRWPSLNGWFVKRPVLAGQWQATISTTWVDPESGEKPDPIVATVKITQTYSSIHMHLETEESLGRFLAAKVIALEDDSYQLAGTFRNEPKLSVRERSPIHLGTLLVDVIGEAKEPEELRGHYFTDRRTTGEWVAQKLI